MLYIENADGTPVDGTIASTMREFARSIWRDLYLRGMAPETWGQATRQVREEFCQEMERAYPALRLCDNHWKANALATAIYSQWYRTINEKRKVLNNDNANQGDNSDHGINGEDESEGPARKKIKTTIIIDDDIHSSLLEPGTHIDNEGLSS